MKKILVGFLSIMMLLTLVGCAVVSGDGVVESNAQIKVDNNDIDENE